MAATPEDAEREITRLRGDMTAAVDEVERRLRGGLRGVASSEARITSVRAGEDALARARDNPTLLGVVGVVVVGAVAYGVYTLVSRARERNKPRNRLRRGVSQFGAELSGRVGEGVESSRRKLERALPQGILLKLEPEDGGYMRVSDARLDTPPAIRQRRGQLKVIKKFVWAAFLSMFLAVSSVLARRVADQAWRAMVHEDPPTEKAEKARANAS